MLNSVGFGAPLFAVLNNGQVQGYIHGEMLQHSDTKDENIRKYGVLLMFLKDSLE